MFTRVSSFIKPSVIIIASATVGFLFSFLVIQMQTVKAADASRWAAGEIIDDSVFYNGNDLTVQQIQQFLDQKIAASGGCDTNGTRASELGGGTRAQYGASRGYPAPYTCLNGYYESPTTHANNLSGNPIPSDGISAAQIIKNAASTYSVSARALLVIIQKESAGPLLTDTWPFPYQYTNALGYGCPDGGVPCDPQYAGFMNQINNAARQFQLYKNSPNNYRKKAQQNNDVLYNPTESCGSSNVFITNNATAGLYNYTPYQPNQAALNNLYGSGDGCSAYGNRNFWRIFNDWFGNTIGPDNSWKAESVNVFANSTFTQQVRTNGSELFLSPGQKIYVQVIARNEGRTTWQQGQTRLGTYSPIDYSSPFSDSSWLAPFRITNFAETSVAPSGTATFNFTLTAPQNAGFYTERYNLVTEGVTWFNDSNLRLYMTVQTPDNTPASAPVVLSSNESLNSGDTLLSTSKHSVLKLQSDGNLDLFTNFSRTWNSNTNNSGAKKLVLQGDGNLVLYTASNSPVWSSNTYNSGANKLVLQNDGNLVLYTASNSPVWSSNTSIQDQTGLVSRLLPNGLTMYPGQGLTTPDRKYSLNYQLDGNVVLYSSSKPIWSTNTYQSSLGSMGMQTDGNLVLVNKDGKVIWNSGTGGRGYSNLLLQQDGNLVLYDFNNQATWASNTSGK